MSKAFRFKLFRVEQDLASMKVGTDGVLLGAWTNIPDFAEEILDVGSGTGVIGLMLAQRSNALTIDAVEVEDNAFLQSVANFENSIWGDRLFCYHSNFEDFADEMADEEQFYDLIVSNPPFYKNSVKTKDKARDLARSEDNLTFEKLVLGVSKILKKEGLFSTIIPFEYEDQFLKIAQQSNLFPNRICHVRGNHLSKVKRSLISLSFTQKNFTISELTIETGRHKYTEDYKNLTKDFYFNM